MTKQTLTFNKELMLRVASYIRTHPSEFNMRTVINQRGCGTTACIAGTTLLLNKGERSVKDFDGHINWKNYSWCWSASNALGLTEEEGQQIFHWMNWPSEYRVRYLMATGEEEANIAADLLEDLANGRLKLKK